MLGFNTKQDVSGGRVGLVGDMVHLFPIERTCLIQAAVRMDVRRVETNGYPRSHALAHLRHEPPADFE